jgi:hypothetical protein
MENYALCCGFYQWRFVREMKTPTRHTFPLNALFNVKALSLLLHHSFIRGLVLLLMSGVDLMDRREISVS